MHQPRPTHAYQLGLLLHRALPRWSASRATVTKLLADLEASGLAGHRIEGSRTVYFATDKAPAALDEWMANSVADVPFREDVHAMVAAALPHHIPRLLSVLDEYVAQCREKLPAAAPAGAPGSWRALTLGLTQSADVEDLEGKIKWAENAKASIEEFRQNMPSTDPPADGRTSVDRA